MREIVGKDGRLSRLGYLVRIVPVGIVLATTPFLFAAGPGFAIIGIALYVIGFVVSVGVAVRRLHDLGSSGALFFILLIPLFNIVLGVIMLFRLGDTEPNEYGEVPVGLRVGTFLRGIRYQNLGGN